MVSVTVRLKQSWRLTFLWIFSFFLSVDGTESAPLSTYLYVSCISQIHPRAFFFHVALCQPSVGIGILNAFNACYGSNMMM